MVYKDLKRTIIYPVIIVAFLLVLISCVALKTGSERNNQSLEAPQEVVRLELEEVKMAFDDGAAIFLDVRSSDSYAISHIPGAKSIPLAELEGRLDELDSNQWIITYCT